MKNVDEFNEKYEEKVQDIKKRKRNLRHIEDPKLVKKMKNDLKREQRGAKRSMYQEVDKYIKEEIEKFKSK